MLRVGIKKKAPLYRGVFSLYNDCMIKLYLTDSKGEKIPTVIAQFDEWCELAEYSIDTSYFNGVITFEEEN